jgi:hypothetical protein
MSDNIFENWCKKLVGPSGQRDHKGGQGVYREWNPEGMRRRIGIALRYEAPSENRSLPPGEIASLTSSGFGPGIRNETLVSEAFGRIFFTSVGIKPFAKSGGKSK